MFKVKKGADTYELHSDVQLAAFLKAGWEEVGGASEKKSKSEESKGANASE